MKMSDEDDDGEHYFLQPVKGYNIVEKIKLANEQLYELEIPYKKNKRSKVQFRENLVDFEPDCSSDDGYGESGTSTSDHETKKNNKSYEESPCDLERELDNLRCCNNINNDKKKSVESEDEESSVEEEEACTKCASSDDEIPDETVCDSEHDYDDDVEDEEDDDENECHGECEKSVKKERTTKDCAECDIVEKVVAELVLKHVQDTDEANKPKPEPPKKKKPLYKSKFGRYGKNSENDTFEVIETEFGRFRGCCRHKVEHVEGMPGYQGAVSLYGLSEQQYAKREERLQKLELQEQQKLAKLKDDYAKKTNETEDAFAQWLKQKAKSKPSRMKNMYDQRPKQNLNVTKVKSQRGPNKKVLPNNSAKIINNNVANDTKT